MHNILSLSSQRANSDIIESICAAIESHHIESHDIQHALENLIDNNVECIIIFDDIDDSELVRFIKILNDDYENASTPIILIAKDECFKQLASKSIISYIMYEGYTQHLQNLLHFITQSKHSLSQLELELDESEKRNIIDPLTKAYNRNGGFDIYSKLISRKKAYNESFCAIMFDIDHFKKLTIPTVMTLGMKCLSLSQTWYSTPFGKKMPIYALVGKSLYSLWPTPHLMMALR